MERFFLLTIVSGLLLLVAIMQLIGGIYYTIDSKTNNRERNLHIFNRNAQEWTDVYRSEFTMIDNFTFKVGTTSKQLVVKTLNPVTSKDKFEDTININYSPYKFIGNTSIRIPPDYETSSSIPFVLIIQQRDMNTTLKAPLFPLRIRAVSITQTECQRKGFWDDDQNYCKIYEKITQFCVKLRTTEDGWAISSIGGNMGCGLNQNWQAETYAPVYLDPEMYSGTFDITIRHLMDPYISAAVITDGTFNFGTDWDAHKLQIGKILGIVGACFFLITIFFTLYTMWKMGRTDTYDYTTRKLDDL